MKPAFSIIFISCFFLINRANSQSPEKQLDRMADFRPVEKVYLQFDRDNYLAGDQGFFKAYLMSAFLPDTTSSVLFVELLSKDEKIINRQVVPVFSSTASGHLDFPDSIASGDYLVRAYTPTMLNDTAGLVFRKQFFIYNAVLKTGKEKMGTDKSIILSFYPEGGNMVSGFRNTIAFKATDQQGLPAYVSGKLMNDQGAVVTQINSFHDGMGLFDVEAETGRSWYVMLDKDSSQHHYPLPAQNEKGIVFSMLPHPQGYFFEIQQKNKDPRFMAAYMIGQMQHQVVFRQDFKPGKDGFRGVLNTTALASGILQVTVFNKDNLPLTERLGFVDNGEYLQPVSLKTDSLSFNEKARNKFTIELKDTVQASVSVSVMDGAYALFPERADNIITHFLLTEDLPGYVHNPRYYFSASDDSVKTSLDLLMMTQGWRRFNWTSLLDGKDTANRYKDPSWIHLSGTINILGTRRAFAEKMIMLFIAGADSTRTLQLLQTDKTGRFYLDSLLFYGNARILFTDPRGKKSQPIQVNLDLDSLIRQYKLPDPAKELFSAAYRNRAGTAFLPFNQLDEILRANGKYMEGVTVRAKKKSLLDELEEKYASGMFSGFSEKTLDLTHVDAPINDQNIFDYLQFRVPGLAVQRDGIDYSIYYRQMASASSMGEIPMTLFLNEMQTDAQVIATIPPNEIAMVKIFNSFVGASGNGAGGVMAIYTKKGSDIYNSPVSSDDQIAYTGFSLRKEFYSPDYDLDAKARAKADQRVTLQWLPDVVVLGINPMIPFSFYAGDKTKKFKVVIEGMTTTGKLIFLEKNLTLSDK